MKLFLLITLIYAMVANSNLAAETNHPARVFAHSTQRTYSVPGRQRPTFFEDLQRKNEVSILKELNASQDVKNKLNDYYLAQKDFLEAQLRESGKDQLEKIKKREKDFSAAGESLKKSILNTISREVGEGAKVVVYSYNLIQVEGTFFGFDGKDLKFITANAAKRYLLEAEEKAKVFGALLNEKKISQKQYDKSISGFLAREVVGLAINYKLKDVSESDRQEIYDKWNSLFPAIVEKMEKDLGTKLVPGLPSPLEK